MAVAGESKVVNGVTWTFNGTTWTDGAGSAKPDAQFQGELQNAARGGASTQGVQAANQTTALNYRPPVLAPAPPPAENGGYDASKPYAGYEDPQGAYDASKPYNGYVDPQGAYDARKPYEPGPTPPPSDLGFVKEAGAKIGDAASTALGITPTTGTMTPERTAAWQESMDRARALADKQSGAYDAAGPRPAPQVAPVQVAPAATAGDVQIQRARDIVAPDVQRAVVGGVGPMEAAGVQRAVVAPVERMEAAGVERAVVGQTGDIANADIARTEDQQTREQQQQSIQRLQQAATGAVPSAAEAQMKLATDRALKQQFALATALQGTSAGSALRAASKGGAEAQLNIAAEGAALRAKEQADARALEAGTLGTVRGQDIGVNTEQAKLVQDARVRNQTAELSTKLAQGQIDQATFALASQNLQNARTQNQQMELQRALAQGDIDSKAFMLASQNLQNARTQNQQVELQRALAQGEIDAKTFIARSQMILDADKSNQAAATQTNIAQGNITAETGRFNASETNKQAALQAGLDKDIGVQNALNQLDQMKIDDTRKAEMGRQMIDAEKIFQSAIAGSDDARAKDAHIAAVQAEIQIAREKLAASIDQSERDFWGNIISSGLSALGAVGAGAVMKSDVRAKTKISDGNASIMDMLDKLKSYDFVYKNPKKHGEGQRHGIMAQDAAKSPLGRSFTLKGKSMDLDVANALGAALSAAANLHHRLKKVEGERG